MANRSPNLASPGLRLRSPNNSKSKSIAISHGDGNIDYSMSNTKAHADNNEQEITLVFSKKKLLGAALSFIAYTAIVVLAVAYATKSDGTSTPNMTSKASSLSSPLSSSMIIDVGGSNTASNTAMANSDGLSTSNQEDTQAKVDTNIVIATTNDLPVSAYTTHSKYSRASSKTSKKAGIDSKSSKATEPVCGLDNNLAACVPRISCGISTRIPSALTLCLRTSLPGSRNITNPLAEVLAYTNSEDFFVKKVTVPEDGDDYDKALYGGTGNLYSKRYPAALVYAENEEEVKAALKCATDNGYNVSPRARGHHYLGMSNMDGHVVIDLSLLCKVDEFEIVKPLEESWLLPGQKWLKSIKSSAGCTNGVMIGYIAKNEVDFPRSEGALYQVGSCPSVGLAGYVTGGGSGLVTPYTGWGSDDLIEVDCLLADGSVVTANKHNEYSDLFWAIRGGGSGFCIILNLTRAVIQSPTPKEGTNRKFVFTELRYGTEDEQEHKRWLTNFQEFLYENPKSSKFGASGRLIFFPQFDFFSQGLDGIYLGRYEELIHDFGDAGLLNTRFEIPGVGGIPSYVVRFPDTEPIPGLIPSQINVTGTRLLEFDKYTDSVIYNLCNLMVTDLVSAFTYVSWSENNNWCADLDIPQAKCVPRSFEIPGTGVIVSITWLQDPLVLDVNPCYDEEVIQKFEDKLSDPTSFMNRGGQVNRDRVLAEASSSPIYSQQGTFSGAIMIPKLEVDVLNKIIKDTGGFTINHLQHGAATVPKIDDTANALRDVAIMTEVTLPVDTFNIIADTLVNEHKPYKGKPSALQGYVNYPIPIGNPNKEKFYYSDNVERLSKIKRKYDPRNVFLQPLQIPAAPDKE